MSISEFYPIFLQHPVVSTDSRRISENCLYFALRGENFDGNKFAIEAIDKGAAFAIVDDETLKDHHKCIFVQDTLLFLQDLAAYHRQKLDFTVVALTGSNGKTTSKELIRNVLSKKFKVEATEGNLNNHIGVPLTLLTATSEIEIMVVEMGANHQGEIAELCKIASPDLGIITNVGKAHLEGFGGVEGVKAGKSELYRHIHAHGGLLFVNGDDDILKSLVPPTTKVEYYYPSRIVELVNHKPFVILKYKGELISTKMVGVYNILNIAVAIAVGEYFDISTQNIIDAIINYIPESNRSQFIKIGTNIYLLDAYNANPSSMELSIKSFLYDEFNDKILVLGDMLELGDETDIEHKNIIEMVSEHKWLDVIYVGKHFYKWKEIYKGNFFISTEESKLYIQNNHFENATFLLKGSRGIALEQILNT